MEISKLKLFGVLNSKLKNPMSFCVKIFKFKCPKILEIFIYVDLSSIRFKDFFSRIHHNLIANESQRKIIESVALTNIFQHLS